MSNIFGYTITGFMVLFVGGGFLWALNNAISLPDVYFSYSSQECVKVVNYAEGHNYSCENLPNRYHHSWVE